jgi:hypothetical protein
LVVLITNILTIAVFAQTPDSSNFTAAKAYIKHVQDSYDKAGHIRFAVKYLYANAGSPGKAIDTLSGMVQMDKKRCRFQLENTQILLTDRYMIRALDEEKLIYLASAKTADQVNPVQAMDSIFTHLQGAHVNVSHGDAIDALVIDLPPGNMYSQIRMESDVKTGFFKRITYRLHTKSLVGEEMIDKPGHPAPYQAEGSVDMIFSAYAVGAFGDAVFDEKDFFIRTGDHFEPTGRYKDYHIFLANSNL